MVNGKFSTRSRLVKKFKKFMQWVIKHAWYNSKSHIIVKIGYYTFWSVMAFWMAPVLWAVFTGALSLGALAITSFA